MLSNRDIESLNPEVLANLTVEELEQRLEMQVLQVPEACWTCSCNVVYCNCNAVIPICTTNVGS